MQLNATLRWKTTMNPRQLLWAALAAVFSCLLFSSTAQAQATRTWVSGVGDDANPCSRTAPCKTFAGAISKTAASGQIDCIDAGAYGAVTITKSITLDCTGEFAGILHSATNGIVINDAATASPGTIVVKIRGIDINGAPVTSPGLNGIRVLSAKSVYVSNTAIHDSTGAAPNGCGVAVAATASPVRVYLRNVEILSNRIGVCVTSVAGVLNSAFIEDSTIEGNSVNSLVVNGANAAVTVSGSVLAPTPVSLLNGAQFGSTGNNRISGAVGPTTLFPLQ